MASDNDSVQEAPSVIKSALSKLKPDNVEPPYARYGKITSHFAIEPEPASERIEKQRVGAGVPAQTRL
jgi:hypothetical protein